MQYAYPCSIIPDEDGWMLAVFPDVPEAGTSGRDLEEIRALARDALAAALAGYVLARRDIPPPGSMARGQYLIALPAVVAGKLALYTAMRETGTSNVALAARLDVSEAAVRRLVNPDHRSHIGSVSKALEALGRTIILQDRVA